MRILRLSVVALFLLIIAAVMLLQRPAFTSTAARAMTIATRASSDAPPLDADDDTIEDDITVTTGYNPTTPVTAVLRVLSGTDSSVLWEIERTTANDLFADRVLTIPDTTDDDIVDLLVTAPRVGIATTTIGRSYLISGEDGSIVAEFAAPPGYHLGLDIALAPDEDEDGFNDVLVEGGVLLGNDNVRPYTFLFSAATAQLLGAFRAPMGAVLERVDDGDPLYLSGDLDADGDVDRNDVMLFFEGYTADDLTLADVNRDELLDASDLAAITANFGESTGYYAIAPEESADFLANWNALYPEHEAEAYEGEDIGDPFSGNCCDIINPTELEECDVEIAGCPSTTIPVDEIVVLTAEGTPEDGTYYWMVSGAATIVGSSTGPQVTLRTTGTGTVDVCVVYIDPEGCEACAHCTFQTKVCSVELYGCNAGLQTNVWDLFAMATPAGGTFTWTITGDTDELQELWVNGNTFHGIFAFDVSATVHVEVTYTVGGCEVSASCSIIGGPGDNDTDGDGLNNDHDPCPELPDCDDDGYDDRCEVILGSDPENDLSVPDAGRDLDMDGLSDIEEVCGDIGTNHLLFDSDHDGAQDYGEAVLAALGFNLNPRHPDTDHDSIPDGEETIYLAFDLDEDGIFDEYEREMGWEPTVADMNDDGVDDGLNLAGGDSPVGGELGASFERLMGTYCPTGSFDSDEDELCNALERLLGTNPYYFDTDEDGLPDGWEVRYGLNPLSDDTDRDGTFDYLEDGDGDGLNNEDEYAFYSDPSDPDSDNDRSSDGDEAHAGGNPNDDSDRGIPPSEDDVVEVDLQVGDHSISESERWQLVVGHVRHLGKLGTVTPPKTYKFQRGHIYKVQLKHRGSKLSPPDFDWTAEITPETGSSAHVSNLDDLLGEHDASEEVHYGSRFAWLVVPALCAHAGTEDVNIQISKAAIIDSGTPTLTAEEECNPGTQTFVNLDNDDSDEYFDIDDPDGVAMDNELARLEVDIATGLPEGRVEITAVSQLKLWRDADKTEAFDLGTPLDYPGDFAGGSVELWVEGIATVNRGVIGATYFATEDSTITLSDSVLLTALGVSSIEWIGIGNAHDDGDVLDADPNWPSGLQISYGVPLVGLRVFPDARWDSGAPETTARDQVTVRVTLSSEPVEPVTLYLRSFDVDDPTSMVEPLDHEMVIDDNRGLTVPPMGLLAGSDSSTGIAELVFDEQQAELGFRTTMQPGDNFRIAAGVEPSYLEQLANEEKSLGTVGSDKMRITNVHIDAPPDEAEIRDAAHYTSHVLTVWRHLYLEVDSMQSVAGNSLATEVNYFAEGLSTGVQTLYTSTMLNATDSSPNDDSPVQGKGRFELGTVRIGDTHDIEFIDGNGDDSIFRIAGLDLCATPLPFVALNDAGTNAMIGTVTLIERTAVDYILSVSITSYSSATPSDWASWVSVTPRASIAGGTAMAITAATMSTGTVRVSTLRVPIVLTDDDWPNEAAIPPPDTDRVKPAFNKAYIEPRLDVLPGDEALPFLANTSTPLVSGWSFDNEVVHDNSLFWVVYVRGAFQPAKYDGVEGDRDPNSEPSLYGIAELGDATYNGRGVDIFYEVIRETTGDPAPYLPEPSRGYHEADIIVHELGHVFGCLHEERGVMGIPGDSISTRYDNIEFSTESLAKIRARVSP